jgi:hypothetical protein
MFITSSRLDPGVIAAALESPLLAHHDVERVSRRTDVAPFALRRIAEDPRWSYSPAVRRNVALNPHTPSDLARALLAELTDDDLDRATRSPRVTRPIAEQAAALLRERRR